MHENVHRQQSRYVRGIVAGAQKYFLKNQRYEAGLELEAWMAMLDYDEFKLTCRMILWIEENIYRYTKILRDKGRYNTDENRYDLPQDLHRAMMQRCLSRQRN